MTAQISYWIVQVKDTARASRFFGSVFGWTFKEGSAGGLHVLGSYPGGGFSALPAGAEPPNRVAAAFQPDDFETAITAVTAAGGSVLSDDSGPEFHGRWAECLDDQGTKFALFAPA